MLAEVNGASASFAEEGRVPYPFLSPSASAAAIDCGENHEEEDVELPPLRLCQAADAVDLRDQVVQDAED